MKWHTLICKEKEEREKKESGSNRPLPHRSAQQTSVLVASTTEEERGPFSLDFHSVLVHLIYICLSYRFARVCYGGSFIPMKTSVLPPWIIQRLQI